tara:strand:+ start:86 stop:529 length:444 start_codon:yes stop_codon:yes gene_type:complete
MLINKIKIKSPKTEKEFNAYYYLRWFVLRKKFEKNIDSSKDELENCSSHIMAIYNQNVIGVGRIHKTDDKNSQIRYMAIDSNFRGFGVGNLILEKLIHIARLEKQKYVILHSREEAIGFYKKNNFRLIEKSHLLYNEIQHYLMQKDL